jgi:hypothetical protein
LANIYAIIGENKKSLVWFNKAFENGWMEYRQNLVYPYMDSLKEDIDFKRIIDKIKLKTDSLKTIIKKENPGWEDCNFNN